MSFSQASVGRVLVNVLHGETLTSPFDLAVLDATTGLSTPFYRQPKEGLYSLSYPVELAGDVWWLAPSSGDAQLRSTSIDGLSSEVVRFSGPFVGPAASSDKVYIAEISRAGTSRLRAFDDSGELTLPAEVSEVAGVVSYLAASSTTLVWIVEIPQSAPTVMSTTIGPATQEIWFWRFADPLPRKVTAVMEAGETLDFPRAGDDVFTLRGQFGTYLVAPASDAMIRLSPAQSQAAVTGHFLALPGVKAGVSGYWLTDTRQLTETCS